MVERAAPGRDMAHKALKAHTSTHTAHKAIYKWILLSLQSVCHNRWPRPLTRVFVAVIERTYPEGWHA
jgi:hypothetical protein